MIPIKFGAVITAFYNTFANVYYFERTVMYIA